MIARKEKVVVAMSGGVDSSVTAALLLESGYEPIGVTLSMWAADENSSAGNSSKPNGAIQAKAVAGHLGISHQVVDCQKEFENLVLRYAWDEYSRGRTPNPCVVCNELVKFKTLREAAQRLGAPFVASGHYARIIKDSHSSQVHLVRGRDRNKDQSYFLFGLPAAWRSQLLMPVGDYLKEQVRELARQWKLPTAEQPESQDTCMPLQDTQFAEALRLRFRAGSPPGPILDVHGKCLGQHAGIHGYTIGQRRGLGLALGHPAYVVGIDPVRHAIVVGTEADGLYCVALAVRRVRWSSEEKPTRAFEARVQIRYRHAAAPAKIEPRADGGVEVIFESPQRAITPGQAVVFYEGDRLVGGGFIETATQEHTVP